MIDPLFIVLAVAGAALLFAFVATSYALAARRRTQTAVALADGLKEGFVAKATELAELTRRHDELARRVARLESPRRRTLAEPPPEPAEAPSEQKLTITERRHRVIALARKGQDAGTIATLLGIPRGEVDLIIGLHRAA